MKEGIHITGISRPESGIDVRIAEQRSESFLDAPSEGEGCTRCTTADFCNAAIAYLADELTTRGIEDHARFLQAHGIEVNADQSLCPGKLVRTAIRHVRSGDFWIAETDPLRNSGERLQIGEALLFSTQSLVERIRNGQTL